jgi:hypothetical protein
MASDGGMTIMDYNSEKSRFGIPVTTVTAVNFPGTLAAWGTFRAAVQGIILGAIHKESLNAFNTVLTNTPPTDANAQVERKWQVSYEGVEAEIAAGIPNPYYRGKMNMEIATAKLVGQLRPNSDEADLTTPEMIAFKAAFEGLVKDPVNKNVQILKLTAIGNRS